MRPMIHFVGFRDDRYWNAVKMFGYPDFIHRRWDLRAQREIMPGDTIVFARGGESQPPARVSGDDLTEEMP
jgi:hypothetical protein